MKMVTVEVGFHSIYPHDMLSEEEFRIDYESKLAEKLKDCIDADIVITKLKVSIHGGGVIQNG